MKKSTAQSLQWRVYFLIENAESIRRKAAFPFIGPPDQYVAEILSPRTITKLWQTSFEKILIEHLLKYKLYVGRNRITLDSHSINCGWPENSTKSHFIGTALFEDRKIGVRHQNKTLQHALIHNFKRSRKALFCFSIHQPSLSWLLIN